VVREPPSARYAISVVAELTGLHPQSIRSYEDRGLLEPARTSGGTRRYSDADVATLLRISGLLGDGLNLAGVEAVMALEAENRVLRDEIERLRAAKSPKPTKSPKPIKPPKPATPPHSGAKSSRRT
jgi:DNA-binding transcriptional MerR regulator